MINLYDVIKIQPDISRLIASKGLVFAYYVCPQKASLQQIYTSESYFIYVISGKKVFHTAGKSFELIPGMSVFIRKGGYFMERFEDDFKIMEIFYSEEYISQVIKEIRIKLPSVSRELPPLELVTNIQTNPSLQACYDSLLPYFSLSPAPSEYLLELKFREFLLNVLLDSDNKGILNYLNQTSENYRPSIQQVVEENYMHNLSLEDYARLSCRSLASFKREFNDFYKESPGKWLVNKKLDYSKMLLQSTNKSIGDIAFESGFENNSHFSRVFKEKFQVAPVAFRKNNEVAAS